MIAVVTARIRSSYNTFIGVCRVVAEGQSFCFPLEDKESPDSVEVRFYPDPPEGSLIGVIIGLAMQADEYVVPDFIDLCFPKSADEAAKIADELFEKHWEDYDVGVGVELYTVSGRHLMTVYDRGFEEVPDFNRDDSPVEAEGWPEDPLAALYDLLIS